MILSGNEWQKHPVVTGPEASCIFGINYLQGVYFKDKSKGYQRAFDLAALQTEEIKQLPTLPDLLEDPSVVGLLKWIKYLCYKLKICWGRQCGLFVPQTKANTFVRFLLLKDLGTLSG